MTCHDAGRHPCPLPASPACPAFSCLSIVPCPAFSCLSIVPCTADHPLCGVGSHTIVIPGWRCLLLVVAAVLALVLGALVAWAVRRLGGPARGQQPFHWRQSEEEVEIQIALPQQGEHHLERANCRLSSAWCRISPCGVATAPAPDAVRTCTIPWRQCLGFARRTCRAAYRSGSCSFDTADGWFCR